MILMIMKHNPAVWIGILLSDTVKPLQMHSSFQIQGGSISLCLSVPPLFQNKRQKQVKQPQIFIFTCIYTPWTSTVVSAADIDLFIRSVFLKHHRWVNLKRGEGRLVELVEARQAFSTVPPYVCFTERGQRVLEQAYHTESVLMPQTGYFV